MGVVLSSQVYSVTFTASSRAALVNAISDAMVQGGWSRTGSSGNWYLTNGAHPNSYSVTVRIWDPGSGNYIRMAISSPVNLEASQYVELDATLSGSWRIITSPNQMYVMNPASFDVVAASKAFICLPYGPSSWAAIGTVDCICCVTGARTQGTESIVHFRAFDASHGPMFGRGHSVMNPGWSTATNSLAAAAQAAHNPSNSRWAKSVVHCEPPLLRLFDTSLSSRIVGYMWDAFFAYAVSAALGDIWTYDGNDYMCIAKFSSDMFLFLRYT